MFGDLMKSNVILLLSVVCLIILSGCVDRYIGGKIASYTAGKIDEPSLSYSPPSYDYIEKQYNHKEYDLPLLELPENYERDIKGKFGYQLSEKQKQQLLDNGVVIVSGDVFEGRYDRFEEAFRKLSSSRNYRHERRDDNDVGGVPIIITTDSVLHLFHIEFNEILKNTEIKKLIPMLNEFLDSSISESIAQYKGLKDKELKELARRNVAYLAVGKKLLDPGYRVPGIVRKDVEEEIKRIEDHKGFYKSPLFSKDCPDVCEKLLYPDNYPGGDACSQMVKDLKVNYQGREWLFQNLYKEVCIKSCYCEDYSQYVPRGHYTLTDELKQYFKSMMWLGRMTFKATGDNWTKQAILLTDAVKSSGKIDLWNKIYTVTGFFAGASDDLTFYEYDTAVFNLFNYNFDENDRLKEQITEKMQEEIRKMRGPEILGGFEFDLAGNLKDTTQGLRLIGQRYAVDSHVLSDLVYNNVGPNPDSEYYDDVIDYCVATSCLGPPVCSKPKEFYQSCGNMEQNKTKYWNEVCDAAIEVYCGCAGCSEATPLENIKKIYSVCRFMPTGLDVVSALGSKRADEILSDKKMSDYCDYTKKNKEMKDLVSSYDQDKWTQNLYNTWLWMLQPVVREKPVGYPNWMRSVLWKNKELSSALSSWAQLRHDTILYVKQSYTVATMGVGRAGSMSSKYYGYVEPNPELYARAKFTTEYLIKGLEEQGVMTEDVKNALEKSRDMMARLQEISEKELEGKALSEADYDYIENIDTTFKDIIENLASALTVTKGRHIPIISEKKTYLEGAYDAFKTTLIADVHTETNSKRVLEVGTGKIDWVIVAHESKDGRTGLAVGPVFSYYEFPWKMSDRLTDEKWREMVDSAERPDWIKEFIS